MNRPLRSIGFIGLIACMALMGFGCKKNTASRNALLEAQRRGPTWLNENLAQQELQAQKKTGTKQPGTTTNQPTEEQNKYAAEMPFLQQVFKNLSLANSFRATLTAPLPDTNQTAIIETEFARTQGIHATLTDPVVPMELYLIGDNAYVRAGTSTWINMASTAEGSRAINILKSAMAVDPNGEVKTILRKSARIISLTEDTSGCKRYIVMQYDENGGQQNLDICVKNGYPATISTVSSDGVSNIQYRDINTPIVLHPPKM